MCLLICIAYALNYFILFHISWCYSHCSQCRFPRTYSLTQQFTCLCPREFVAYDCQDSCRATGTHRRHLCSKPGALARLTLIHIYIYRQWTPETTNNVVGDFSKDSQRPCRPGPQASSRKSRKGGTSFKLVYFAQF